MTLQGRDGTRLTLEPLRDAFADVAGDDWDDRWLVVRLRVEAPQGSYEARFPCLLTWEAEDLARWLELVADDQEVEPLLEFTEPNLAFAKVDADPERVTLRVTLRAEFAPPWARPPAPGAQAEAELELVVRREALRAAAATLRRELAA